MPKGKQFIMKKKLNQLITTELEKEQTQWWYEIEKASKTLYIAEIKASSGIGGKEYIRERNDEMIINCDFLIEKKHGRTVFKPNSTNRAKVYHISGCTFQVSGPMAPLSFFKRKIGMIKQWKSIIPLKNKEMTLLDLLDGIIDTGVVVSGEILISIANIDLIVVDLKLLISSIESAYGPE